METSQFLKLQYIAKKFLRSHEVVLRQFKKGIFRKNVCKMITWSFFNVL